MDLNLHKSECFGCGTIAFIKVKRALACPSARWPLSALPMWGSRPCCDSAARRNGQKIGAITAVSQGFSNPFYEWAHKRIKTIQNKTKETWQTQILRILQDWSWWIPPTKRIKNKRSFMWSNPMGFCCLWRHVVYLPMANVVMCGSGSYCTKECFDSHAEVGTCQGQRFDGFDDWIDGSWMLMVMVKGWLMNNGWSIMINEWMINGWFSWSIKLNGQITNIDPRNSNWYPAGFRIDAVLISLIDLTVHHSGVALFLVIFGDVSSSDPFNESLIQTSNAHFDAFFAAFWL